MNIIIFGAHQWPVPSPANTGHRVYLDLAIALSQLGHSVQLCAPTPSDFPSVLPMMCSHGQPVPGAAECELNALAAHREAFDACDVIHDWSVLKSAAQAYPEKTVSTHMSGNTDRPTHGRNGVVWSEEMRARALRGASDYEGTEFRQWARDSRPLKDARVVMGGVDTDFWCPYDNSYGEDGEWGYPKDDHVLWLGRWHEARGYRLAIDMARENPDIKLVMSGESPADRINPHQGACAVDAVNYAAGLSNVRFEFLPQENHREAVREKYRRARAYLFTPRFHEPFGLSQVEALSCGTPVIGTRMGSVPEVVKSGLTGFVWSPGDTSSFASVVDSLGNIANAECRDDAVRRFDRRVMAAAYVERYRECLAGGWG